MEVEAFPGGLVGRALRVCEVPTTHRWLLGSVLRLLAWTPPGLAGCAGSARPVPAGCLRGRALRQAPRTGPAHGARRPAQALRQARGTVPGQRTSCLRQDR